MTSQDQASGGNGVERVHRARTRRIQLREAMKELEHAVARPSTSADWSDAVDASLASLRKSLESHIREVERSDGLLAEITDKEPRLTSAVDQMKSDHQELLEALADAERVFGDGTDPSATRRTTLILLGNLATHRQQGSDLVFEAYNVDIAAGD